MKFKLIILILVISALGLRLAAQDANVLNNKYRLAKSYEQANDYEKAKSIYVDLLAAQPWNQQYFTSLNNVYLRLKEYDKSIKLLNDRIQKNPNDVAAYGMLGSTYYVMGSISKAYEEWEKGIEINSSINNVRIITNYCIENRAYEKAIEFYLNGRASSSDRQLFSYELANLYSATMDFENAANEYCKIIADQPNQVEAIKKRMITYLTAPEALEITIKIVKTNYSSLKAPVFLDLLSFLYLEKKDFDEALNATILFDKDQAGGGVKIFTFAQTAFAEKDYSSASKAFKYIIDKYPASPYAATSKIGFAKTYEASLDAKHNTDKSSWKPFAAPDTSGMKFYIEVANAYEELASAFPWSEIANEANYRLGLLNFNKFLNSRSAEARFLKVSNEAPLSNFAASSNIQLAEIELRRNNYPQALNYLSRVTGNVRAPAEFKSYADYIRAKLEFWKGHFAGAQKYLSVITENLNDNLANDALELSIFINSTKSDSLNLVEFAKADEFLFQSNFERAAEVYQKLSELEDSFIISSYSKYYHAVSLLALNRIDEAIIVLKEISVAETFNIYADKSLYLQAQCYYFGLNNKHDAIKAHERLLEKFPNSLYFEKSRQQINNFKSKSSESL
ncbi:MAG: tetratricopeptide repeat protein [Bacteroidetes bacterium]|nr:tetratricopeptide repeat protein [Bacteroidota bacterium]